MGILLSHKRLFPGKTRLDMYFELCWLLDRLSVTQPSCYQNLDLCTQMIYTRQTRGRKRMFPREREMLSVQCLCGTEHCPYLPPLCSPTWKTVSFQWASHRRRGKILKLIKFGLVELHQITASINRNILFKRLPFSTQP